MEPQAFLNPAGEAVNKYTPYKQQFDNVEDTHSSPPS